MKKSHLTDAGEQPPRESKGLEYARGPKEPSGRKGEADLSRRTILAHLRHELRTPLNAIIGYSEMLLEDAEETGRKSLAGGLHKLHRGGLALFAIVNEILDPAKIDSGETEVDPAEIETRLYRALRAPLGVVIEHIERLLESAKGMEGGEFLSDLRKIDAAAFRFLGYIDSSANPAGIGGEETEQRTGTGDTLRMAQEAMESIQSRESEIAAPEKMGGRILVVDDNEMNRDLLSRRLERQGHSTLVAENGRLAIDIIRARSPDLVLLDIMMPGMNGYEVLQYLKGNDSLRNIPVIMISALDEMESVIRCIEMGAEDYLTKPVDPVLLRARIGACLEKKRLLDQEIEHQKRLKELNAKLELRNRFIRQTFGRYLSDEIVESILETPEGLNLGGEKRTVTIMMADLRGFTSIGERLPPESVVSVINHYLETMTDIILKYHGTIDEFLGDAILVIFGAPVQRRDDAGRAVACAVEMQKAMVGINEWNRQAGYPEIKMGIGINTGEVVVGNIGSRKRAKYGIVGCNVNLTSRIESYTVGGQIFVSESTTLACGPILRLDDKIRVMPKGVRDPITIYEVGGIRGGFDLCFPPKGEVPLLALIHPLPIRFTILTGKRAGHEMHKANILKMGDGTAEIQSGLAPERFTDLKITLLDHGGQAIFTDIYAKVTKILPSSLPTFRAVFTSIPSEAKEFLKG